MNRELRETILCTEDRCGKRPEDIRDEPDQEEPGIWTEQRNPGD